MGANSKLLRSEKRNESRLLQSEALNSVRLQEGGSARGLLRVGKDLKLEGEHAGLMRERTSPREKREKLYEYVNVGRGRWTKQSRRRVSEAMIEINGAAKRPPLMSSETIRSALKGSAVPSLTFLTGGYGADDERSDDPAPPQDALFASRIRRTRHRLRNVERRKGFEDGRRDSKTPEHGGQSAEVEDEAPRARERGDTSRRFKIVRIRKATACEAQRVNEREGAGSREDTADEKATLKEENKPALKEENKAAWKARSEKKRRLEAAASVSPSRKAAKAKSQQGDLGKRAAAEPAEKGFKGHAVGKRKVRGLFRLDDFPSLRLVGKTAVEPSLPLLGVTPAPEGNRGLPGGQEKAGRAGAMRCPDQTRAKPVLSQDTQKPPICEKRGGATGKSAELLSSGQEHAIYSRQAREVKRKMSQALWRERVRTANAAKSAMSSAKAVREASVASARQGVSISRAMSALAPTAPATALAVMAVASALLLAIVLAMVAHTTWDKYNRPAGNGGEELAKWAIGEYEEGPHAGGEEYWKHCGFGGRVEWCSCFVKTGWDACGFNESIGDKGSPLANSWITWVKNDSSVGSLIRNDESYSAKPGDIIVSGQPTGQAADSHHVGIVVEEEGERGQFRCIEGNSGDAIASTYYFPGSYWDWVFRPNYPDSAGYALGEGVNFNVSETTFVREWGPRIDAWLEKMAKASEFGSAPLQGFGEEFARAAYENGIDPRLSPMISWQESKSGNLCFLPYNAWGWGSSSWSSWPEAISAHLAGLKAGYSNMTIEEIVRKYCPDGTEETYIAHLKEWIGQF